METRSEKDAAVSPDPTRAILVALSRDADDEEEVDANLAELSRLAKTAGLTVCAELVQIRKNPDASTAIGSGKLAELADLCRAREAGICVFDTELSPTQIRNVEKALPEDTRVIDRTMLILDIFAKNAKTNEGMLQVEIAQLKYNIPRLTGRGTELSRLGGGIGTRGPGESKLESDKRHVRRRIFFLEKRLAALSASRDLRRGSHRGEGVYRVVIAGYTNAGKSTLLNYLTGAGILAEDKLFATLDPTTRKLKLLSGQEVLLTDTVGFIDRLPHHLVEAFASTLDEVAYADVLLLLFDVSTKDLARQTEVCRLLLEKLYADRKVCAPKTIFVYNKCDLEREPELPVSATDACARVFVSAKTGKGVPELLKAIEQNLNADRQKVSFSLPRSRADVLDILYRKSRVLAVEYTDTTVEVTALAEDKIIGKYREYLKQETT